MPDDQASTAVLDAPEKSGPASDSSTQGASAPSTSSGANGTAAHTAPAATLHREAFARLSEGQKPDQVNRELFAPKPAAGKAKSSSTPASPDDAASEPKPDASAPPAAAAGKYGYPDGTSDADAKVLKRAKMDPETWAAIPPSNRVKIVKGLRDSQAAADREFSRRAAASGKAQARTPAPAATQSPADPQDAATLDGDDAQPDTAGRDTDDASSPAPDRPAKPDRAQAAKAQGAGPESVESFIDPKDLETLELIGGNDLAQTLQRTTARVVDHFTQREAQQRAATSQLLDVAEFLLEQHVNREFDSGLDRLTAMPGLENLRDDSRQKERDALRAKADLLHRAAGDPKGYSYQDALQDAAASLFKTNIHQTAQARLLQGRNASLRATPSTPDYRRGGQQKPLSAKDRNAAIFAELQRGASPDDARAIVDGR